MRTFADIVSIILAVVVTVVLVPLSAGLAAPIATPTPSQVQKPSDPSPQPSTLRVLKNQRHFTFASGASMARVSLILSSCRVSSIKHLYSQKEVTVDGIAGAIQEAPVSKGEARSRADFPERAARGVGVSPAKEMDATFLAFFPSPDAARCAEEALRKEGLITKSGKPSVGVLNQNIPPQSFQSKIVETPIPSSLNLDRSYMRALESFIPPGVRLRTTPIVAIIDTGVAIDHPDLRGSVFINKREIPRNGKDDDLNGLVDDVYGGNFACQEATSDYRCIKPPVDGDVRDYRGHGTHVAGIAVGRGAVPGGVKGVAPSAMIIPVRVFGEESAFTSSSIASAIRYATDRGAHAMNLSLGWSYSPTETDPIVRDAVMYARANGSVVIFAAGNEEEKASNHAGCSISEAVCVSASLVSKDSLIQGPKKRASIKIADFSNFGIQVDITAPGEAVWSTTPCLATDENGNPTPAKCSFPQHYYAKRGGTSMAAPHVTALAALVAAVNPRLTADQIKSVIQITASDAFEPGHDALGGAGLINVRDALNYANDIYLGQRPLPPTIRILEPTAVSQAREGQVVPLGFEALSEGGHTYSVKVHDAISGKMMSSVTGGASPSRLYSVPIDTAKVGVGLFVVEVSLSDSRGNIVSEWRDLQISPQNQSVEIEAMDIGFKPDAYTSMAWPIHFEEFGGRLWVLEEGAEDAIGDGKWYRYLRERFLTFSPKGMESTPAAFLIDLVDSKIYEAYKNWYHYARYPEYVGLWSSPDYGGKIKGFATLDTVHHRIAEDPEGTASLGDWSDGGFAHNADYSVASNYVVDERRYSLFIRKGATGRFTEIKGVSARPFLLDGKKKRIVAYSLTSPEILLIPLNTPRVAEHLVRGEYPVEEIVRTRLPSGLSHVTELIHIDGANLLMKAGNLAPNKPSELFILNLETSALLPTAIKPDEYFTAAIHGEDVYYTKGVESSPFFGRKPALTARMYSIKTGEDKAILTSISSDWPGDQQWIKLSNGLLLYRDKGIPTFTFQQYRQRESQPARFNSTVGGSADRVD